ncbi:MAG: 5-(carboxyamino)imidazole ribonucleotide synthase [Gammaproteobacteria bacterium]|nr:5-(carboxyamino)imidazole ribonucleotide synthase [Gammaproteobacteria bacterium]
MRLGIIGAGQLATMLALAAKPLGIHCRCLAKNDQEPAHSVAELVIIDEQDHQAITEFVKSVDVITFENENVSPELLDLISAQAACVYPNSDAIKITQDRLLEKRQLAELSIPTVAFAPINSQAELTECVKDLGYPALLKTRRLGYDGKGQYRLDSDSDITGAWQQLGQQPLIIEQWLPFDFELSIIAARRASGETAYYPLTQNTHHEGILRRSNAPYDHSDLWQRAVDYADRLLEKLNYVGVLAIECFVKDDQLYVNELAPRVHNSGHWTIEGANTSQFENHLRAIFDLPLGDTSARSQAVMFNCIGTMPDIKDILNLSHAHYHDYAKTPRSKRKLGHVTWVGNDIEHSTLERLARLLDYNS